MTQLVVLGGPPGVAPAVGTVVVYPKADELLYFQGSDAVEHPLAGQANGFGGFDGAAVSILYGNGVFSAIARHAAEPAGVFDVTLATPVDLTGSSPADVHGKWFIGTPAGLIGRFEPIGFTGVPGLYTGIKVTLTDGAGVKTDGKFEIVLVPV